MSDKDKSLGRKWWMGWQAFAWVLSGAVAAVLLWLLVSLQTVVELEDVFWLSPGGILSAAMAAFSVLVALAFVVFRIRHIFSWVFGKVGRLLRACFRRRVIRRCLYAVACLAIIVTLFYVEEDWRGKREWSQYKRAAEATGERFDLQSFYPPHVPDDQNFALSPIVAESCLYRIGEEDPMVQSGTTNRHLDIRINAPYELKPWPTNDFEGNWQCGKRIDLRAFQLYYRTPLSADRLTFGRSTRRRGYAASSLNPSSTADLTNEFPVAPRPQTPAADVLLALSKYDSSIEELRQASGRPFFQFPFLASPETTNGFSANLAPLSDCVVVLRLRAVAELESDQSQRALEDVKLMLYLANLNYHAPWREAWRQDWRLAKVNLAMQPVWQGLVDHKWTDAQLTEIAAELEKFNFLAEYQYSVRNWCVEAIRAIDFFEQTRFHDFLEQLHFNSDQDDDSLWQRVFSATPIIFMPKGWFYENEVAVAEMARQSLRTAAEVDERTFPPEVANRCHDLVEANSQNRSLRNFAASGLYYGFGVEAKNFAFIQSFLDQAIVACSLERYRLAKAEYPPNLESLAVRFKEILPRDIINGQPLHYRRTDDGRFLLYSVGWNEKDDGGRVVLNQRLWRGSIDKNKGDWVWPSPQD